MKILLHITLIFSISGLFADQRLDLSVYQHAEYALRWHPDADTVSYSLDSSWEPWITAGSFGWQILNRDQLSAMFVCDERFMQSIDFEQTLVLSVIRYDEVSWNFFPRKAIFDSGDATIRLEYDAVTRTTVPGEKVLSSAIFLLTITESLRKTGITNLGYQVSESQQGPWPGGCSPYPAPVAEIWFPIAYTLADLKRSHDRRKDLLTQLKPDSSTQSWVPDYLTIEHLRIREGIRLKETTVMTIRDSLHWASLFDALEDQNGWTFIMTQEDFRHYFVIVIAKRDPGKQVTLRDIFWAEQGLRIDTSVTTDPQQAEPDVLVILMPKGDYGVLSFRENGQMADLRHLH